MPRIARAVATNHPHHITQRGNYRQTVFETDKDYKQYLEWLKIYSEKYGLELWAYCLMKNHVHFVCVPKRKDSLALTFNTLHMRYAQHINRRRKVHGHLWQGRFYSTILDELHVHTAVRYVESNPVRSGIVTKAEQYPWSSARAHTAGTTHDLLSTNCYLLSEVKDWKKYLREEEEKKLIHDIRKNTLTGRPCGDEGFIRKLERAFGRRLQALPHGRPRKPEK